MKECCFSSRPETSSLNVQYSLRACDGGSWGWIPHCRSIGGRAVHWHPCRLFWAEMWEGSGCHHIFVQQNPPSYTTGCGWLWIYLHTCNGSARLWCKCSKSLNCCLFNVRSCSSRDTALSHELAPSSLACTVDLSKSSCLVWCSY